MAEPIYKVVEVVGTSEESVSKAIERRHRQSRADVASTWLSGRSSKFAAASRAIR